MLVRTQCQQEILSDLIKQRVVAVKITQRIIIIKVPWSVSAPKPSSAVMVRVAR
jgi:hypothetical protein